MRATTPIKHSVDATNMSMEQAIVEAYLNTTTERIPTTPKIPNDLDAVLVPVLGSAPVVYFALKRHMIRYCHVIPDMYEELKDDHTMEDCTVDCLVPTGPSGSTRKESMTFRKALVWELWFVCADNEVNLKLFAIGMWMLHKQGGNPVVVQYPCEFVIQSAMHEDSTEIDDTIVMQNQPPWLTTVLKEARENSTVSLSLYWLAKTIEPELKCYLFSAVFLYHICALMYRGTKDTTVFGQTRHVTAEDLAEIQVLASALVADTHFKDMVESSAAMEAALRRSVNVTTTTTSLPVGSGSGL